MSIWRTVEVWPRTGFVDTLWHPLRNLDDDAFTRSAQRVAALYNEAILALKLPLRPSVLRLTVAHQPEQLAVGTPATVEVPGLQTEGLHYGFIQVPPGVADLSPTARGLLALDAIQAAALRVAELASWEPARLAPARAHVLDRHMEYRWASKWKSSPNRRRKARLQYRIDDDGLGRGRIEVADGNAILATEWTYCGNERFVAESLRWDGSDAITVRPMGEPHLVPPDNPAKLIRHPARTAASLPHLSRIDVDGLREVQDEAVAIDPNTQRPEVHARQPEKQRPNHVAPPAVFGMGEVPTPLASAMTVALDGLTSATWNAWWASTGAGVLDIEVSLGDWAGRRMLMVRRQADRVVVRLNLPLTAIPSQESEYCAFARDQVVSMLDRVADRVEAKAHPEVSIPEIDWQWVRERDEYRQAARAADRAHLAAMPDLDPASLRDPNAP